MTIAFALVVALALLVPAQQVASLRVKRSFDLGFPSHTWKRREAHSRRALSPKQACIVCSSPCHIGKGTQLVPREPSPGAQDAILFQLSNHLDVNLANHKVLVSDFGPESLSYRIINVQQPGSNASQIKVFRSRYYKADASYQDVYHYLSGFDTCDVDVWNPILIDGRVLVNICVYDFAG